MKLVKSILIILALFAAMTLVHTAIYHLDMGLERVEYLHYNPYKQ